MFALETFLFLFLFFLIEAALRQHFFKIEKKVGQILSCKFSCHSCYEIYFVLLMKNPGVGNFLMCRLCLSHDEVYGWVQVKRDKWSHLVILLAVPSPTLPIIPNPTMPSHLIRPYKLHNLSSSPMCLLDPRLINNNQCPSIKQVVQC